MKKLLTVLCGVFIFSLLSVSVSAHDEIAAIAAKNKAKAESIAAKNAAKAARLEHAKTNDAERIAQVEARRAAKIAAADARKSGKSAKVTITGTCTSTCGANTCGTF